MDSKKNEIKRLHSPSYPQMHELLSVVAGNIKKNRDDTEKALQKLQNTELAMSDLQKVLEQTRVASQEAYDIAVAAKNAIADLQGLEGSTSDAELLASLVVRVNILEQTRPPVKDFSESEWNRITQDGTDLSISDENLCLVYEEDGVYEYYEEALKLSANCQYDAETETLILADAVYDAETETLTLKNK